MYEQSERLSDGACAVYQCTDSECGSHIVWSGLLLLHGLYRDDHAGCLLFQILHLVVKTIHSFATGISVDHFRVWKSNL